MVVGFDSQNIVLFARGRVNLALGR